MKKTIILLSILACAAVVLSSCKNSGKRDNSAGGEPQTEAVDDSAVNDLARVPAHDNSAEDDERIMDFLIDNYIDGTFLKPDALEGFCTDNLLRQLREDYSKDYEGDGYATWDFYTETQDPDWSLNDVLKVQKIDGRYYFEASHGGVLFRNIISAFVQDGNVMLDGITRDKTYSPQQ